MIPSQHKGGIKAATALVAGPLVTQYPHNERYRLGDGTDVFLPVHQVDFDFLVLSGDAIPEKVDELLASENLIAARHQVGNVDYAEIQIYVITYRAGDAGAYREMFEVFSVKDPPQSGFQQKPCPQYYVRRVRVDAELPLRFGIDVWGYPKQRGATTYDTSTRSGSVTFSYSEPGEPDPSFSGWCDRNGFAAYPGNPPFEFVTPFVLRRSYASIINAPRSGGTCQWKTYDSKSDRFIRGTSTELGKELDSLGFRPMRWFLCENMEAVGFLGDQPAPAPAPTVVERPKASSRPESQVVT